MRASASIERTPQRTKHVLHMFCERTVINIRHVACQVELRSLVHSRYLLAQLRIRVHCRWRVMSSLSTCLWSLSTQFHVAGIGINLFCGTPRVIPTMLHLHKQARAQKTTFEYWARTLSRGLQLRMQFDFVLFFWRGTVICVHCCTCVFSVRVLCKCCIVFLCARLSVFIFGCVIRSGMPPPASTPEKPPRVFSPGLHANPD